MNPVNLNRAFAGQSAVRIVPPFRIFKLLTSDHAVDQRGQRSNEAQNRVFNTQII